MNRLSLFLLALLCVPSALAQTAPGAEYEPSDERVDRLERRADLIAGNNIRATITNWNQTGQSGQPGDINYEFPRNTRRIYVALSQLWVGARVQGTTGPLTVFDVSDFRVNPDGESDNSWTFQPVEGYVNPSGSEAGIAQSDDPNSWPARWPDKLSDPTDPGWPGSWNGFFGKNIFNADQEFMFKAGDDQYDRYLTGSNQFYPDSTDLTRGGLAVIVESRVLAWSQVLIQDVVFLLYSVTNDGTTDYEQVGVAIWLADLVGGDSADDEPFFDLSNSVAFLTDSDGRGTEPFGADRVGVAGIAFLETPGNAIDRIDNDGDGSTDTSVPCTVRECGGPVLNEAFIAGENPTNGVDDNGNGLIDESVANIPISTAGVVSLGVGYADYIDNDSDGEGNSPQVTQAMIDAAQGDAYGRWPYLTNDPFFNARNTIPGARSLRIHLLSVNTDDLGLGYADGIDNDDSCVSPTAAFPFLSEPGSPVVTQAMVTEASADPFGRFLVVSRIDGQQRAVALLVGLDASDIGKCYADGIDNDGDGAIDEGIDEGIDEMIDESRSDFIDNDGDWDPLRDDTGLDGIVFSGDRGDNDGVPTSGAGTGFPGEKNIDVTDVSESDQIGITNVQRIPAFSLNFNSQGDGFLYNTYLLPGDIDVRAPLPGENDLVISSGLFPLDAGQTERISLAVSIAASASTNLGNQEQVLRNVDNARDAYAADYQFAQAPIVPTLTSVPGDGRVTLYWNSASEDSFDQFLSDIGRDPNDFEGYLLYRATDPAFLDPLNITDGFGRAIYRTPIARFDLKDGRRGFQPVDVNGVKFNLGDDTGLQHSYVDSTVTNGIRYFYALTAYDYGSVPDNISPTETPILIEQRADGTVIPGPNVQIVVPNAPVAGYNAGTIDAVERVRGFTSSRIGFRIVDPTVLEEGRRFRVTFRDTVLAGRTNSIADTLTTRDFSLIEVATGDTLVKNSKAFRGASEFPVFDDRGRALGFSLTFFSDPFTTLNRDLSGWNEGSGNAPITLDPYLAAGFIRGVRNPADYRVDIIGDGEGQSTQLEYRRRRVLQARPTNIRITNTASGQEVAYAFLKLSGPSPDVFGTSAVRFEADNVESDLLILIEPPITNQSGTPVVTWQIGINNTLDFQGLDLTPDQGESVAIVTRKPFLSADAFEFGTRASVASADSARGQLGRIRVVPNPYVAANRFEPQSAFDQGRGPRVIRFINMPPQATVRIFTVSGRLVRTLEMNEGMNDPMTPAELLNGTITWDLQTNDNLSVAYGVYVYHVEAPNVGEKTGTFAIIK